MAEAGWSHSECNVVSPGQLEIVFYDLGVVNESITFRLSPEQDHGSVSWMAGGSTGQIGFCMDKMEMSVLQMFDRMIGENMKKDV
jgi:hypothetical protein